MSPTSRSAALAVAALAAASASACRISLEDGVAPPPVEVDAGPSPSCVEATTRQDLAFLEQKVFGLSCRFSGCHNGNPADAAGIMDLREGMSHASLVGVDSQLDPRFKLVAPGQPTQSYLLMMVQHIAPGDMSPPTTVPEVGLMPLNTGGQALCTEKLQALERWILAGAPAS